MSIQAGFSLNCYFYIWLLFLSQGNMCTFLNMQAELAWIAPGKVFCINESELIKKKKKKEFIWELKSGKTQVYFQIVYKQKEESEVSW